MKDYENQNKVSRGMDIGTCGGCSYWSQIGGKVRPCLHPGNAVSPPPKTPLPEYVNINFTPPHSGYAAGGVPPLAVQGSAPATITPMGGNYQQPVAPLTTDLSTCSDWEPRPGVLAP